MPIADHIGPFQPKASVFETWLDTNTRRLMTYLPNREWVMSMDLSASNSGLATSEGGIAFSGQLDGGHEILPVSGAVAEKDLFKDGSRVATVPDLIAMGAELTELAIPIMAIPGQTQRFVSRSSMFHVVDAMVAFKADGDDCALPDALRPNTGDRTLPWKNCPLVLIQPMFLEYRYSVRDRAEVLNPATSGFVDGNYGFPTGIWFMRNSWPDDPVVQCRNRNKNVPFFASDPALICKVLIVGVQ